MGMNRRSRMKTCADLSAFLGVPTSVLFSSLLVSAVFFKTSKHNVEEGMKTKLNVTGGPPYDFS